MGGSTPPPGTKINGLRNQRIFRCVFLCANYGQGHLDPTDTLNTSTLSDLRELKTQQLAKERFRAAIKIKQLISEDGILRETIKAVPEKKERIAQLGEEQKSLEKQLPAAENAQEAQAQTDLGDLRQQLQKMQTTVAGFKQIQLRLRQLQDQIATFKVDFENRRAEFKSQAANVGVSEAVFDVELAIKGEQALVDRGAELEAQILKWEGKGIDDVDITIAKVNAQIRLTESLVATDKAKRDQIQQLQKRIATISQEITLIQTDVLAVESTNIARSKAIREARLETYTGLFKSWRREQSVLEKLYEPIRDKLLSGVTEEKMLDFYIRWDVDLDDWLEQGRLYSTSVREIRLGQWRSS